MHEKTLLYSALGVTVLAAGFMVYRTRSGPSTVDISPISIVDSPKTVSATEVPIRLTASDGTGLKLSAIRAEAAIEDPLALTELHLTFENPEDRVLEGTFRITLPQGASLSRFAMKVGDAWQEGEVVEKQAARQAYEDFLHRKQDPALMEQGAGNEFSARVFPIPARGTKEIIVTYAEALEVGASYVLPLRGLPELGALDVNVHVRGSIVAVNGGKPDAAFAVQQRRFTPNGDFVVEANRIPRSHGLRNGDLAIARVIPFASSRPEPVTSALVLVDTSASRGLGITEQANALRSILAKLPADTRVKVACFDQDVMPVFEGKASEFGQKHVDAIAARGALGASDFEGAIAWAAAHAKEAKASRIVWLTDGVATAGETDGQKLREKVEALRGAGITRMDAIAIGGIRDDGFLRTVVRGVLDRDGVVLDAKLGPEALARRLGEATSSGVAVKVDGAKWSWPTTLDGLQAGDEVLVYAELEGSRPLKIDVGGQPFQPDLRTIERPLVERAWAQAKIQSLIEAPTQSAAATKQEIVALSTHHRVLSPLTALLVLETDRDYQRFGIDRTAKVDILTVSNGAVAVTQSGRGGDEAPKKQAATKPWSGSRAKGAEGAAAPAAAPMPTPTPEAVARPMEQAPAAQPSLDRDDGERSRSEARADSPRPSAPEPEPPPPSNAAPGDPSSGPGLGLLGSGAGGGGASDGRGLGALGGHAEAPARPSPTMAPAASAAPPRASRRAPPSNNADSWGLVEHESPPRGSTSVVRPEELTIDTGIAASEVQGVIRGAVPKLRRCFGQELQRNPTTGGRLRIRFVVSPSGATSAEVAAPGGEEFKQCLQSVAKSLQFTAPQSGEARFTQSFVLIGDDNSSSMADMSNVPKALPYEGRFKLVMESLQRGDSDAALTEANRWHAEQPGDVLSLVALGEVFEAKHDLSMAARAYGSILELFSFRADSRRFAGERLERLKDDRALALAVDSYAKAVEQRPDHPASHRLYAYALLKRGEYEKAFAAMKKGASRTYPAGRFRGVDRILKEDLGLIASAWSRAEPSRASDIKSQLVSAGGSAENGPSLRFILNWETDANDVDFHIHDGRGGHAYYSQPQLPSGGELYADVTTGYGPECFTIRGAAAQRAYPYTLQAHYFSRGPMGYGMGKLEVIEHDGNGKLSFEERPFVVMIDHAFVDMGKVEPGAKLKTAAMK